MIDKPKVLHVRVTEVEYKGLMHLCEKWNVKRQDALRAFIIDALVDEGIDVLRCKQSKRCKSGTETAEGCRPTA